MSPESASNENTEAACAEPNAERGLEYVGEAYGKKVEMQIRETIRLNNLNPKTADDILAMVEGACNIVFASHFEGMEAVERNVVATAITETRESTIMNDIIPASLTDYPESVSPLQTPAKAPASAESLSLQQSL